MPTQAERQADEQRGQPAQRRIAEGAETVTKASTISAKYSRGPKASASFTTQGARKASPSVAISRRRRSRWPRSPAPARRGRPGHLVAFERGDDRGAFARRVEQDRGGRAAIHAAVIDAGEHDQRAGRVELVGHGQQQRHGQRRADAGQHADGGAQRHADQRIEQVHRLGAVARPCISKSKSFPWLRSPEDQMFSSGPAGRLSMQKPAKTIQTTKAKTMPTGRSSTAVRLPEAPRGQAEQDARSRWKSPRHAKAAAAGQPADDPQDRAGACGGALGKSPRRPARWRSR
jgi:hypothetical protein